MRLPTLHQELITALAFVFAGALIVAATGVIVLLPRFSSPAQAATYITILLVADIIVFAIFGRYLIQRRVLAPLNHLIESVEAIAEGDYARDLPQGETSELARLSDSVTEMAHRLIHHRQQLAANVRSLDDTNRQLTEVRDELVRAEKMTSVGRLAAGIAHEIGNPLGAVLGYIAVLERSAGERERELLSAAQREAQRIDRIVRGLLDYARPRDAQPQPMDVNHIVERSINLLATQGRLSDVALRIALAPELPAVVGDPYQLEQVLVNLMLNASDALANRNAPTLQVSTGSAVFLPTPGLPERRRDDPPDLDYSHRRRFHQLPRLPRENPLAPGGPIVEIVVEDNGTGIPADLLEQIFEPFVTTKEPGKGTGLGLAVSARLVDAMGGTIRVESDNGGGARFTILLPAAAGVLAHAGAT